MLITIARTASPSEHLDIIILLLIIDSLKQKNNEDLVKGGFLPWRIDYTGNNYLTVYYSNHANIYTHYILLRNKRCFFNLKYRPNLRFNFFPNAYNIEQKEKQITVLCKNRQ